MKRTTIHIQHPLVPYMTMCGRMWVARDDDGVYRMTLGGVVDDPRCATCKACLRSKRTP